ncbi:MAG TPA: N-acetylmuramoyl-L-alanine amidase [Burkholderiales bacterium]|nr:N-acetylmuramoyl-L-alanine amidase [Burkholderiales bacterium]
MRGLTGASLALGVAVLALSACTPLPIRTTLPVDVRPSPNFGERRPNYVILHHTTNNDAGRALVTLTSPISQVSAHYLVGRDGRIAYLVDEWLRAWHAGESYWGGNRDLNSASIGIELDNNGEEPYAERQIEALLALLADLKARWSIPAANFLGHGDIAPGRKVDPGRLFPWRRLAAQGYGLWCDPPYGAAPAGADDELLLAALGYDVSRLPAAVAAFKRHYAPDDTTAALSDDQRAMARCLIARLTDLSE